MSLPLYPPPPPPQRASRAAQANVWRRDLPPSRPQVWPVPFPASALCPSAGRWRPPSDHCVLHGPLLRRPLSGPVTADTQGQTWSVCPGQHRGHCVTREEQGHFSECLARAVAGLGAGPDAPKPCSSPSEVAARGPRVLAAGPCIPGWPGEASAPGGGLLPPSSPAARAASSPGWSLPASWLLWERQDAIERRLVSGSPGPGAWVPASWRKRVLVAKGARDQPHSVPTATPGVGPAPLLRAVSTGGPCPQQQGEGCVLCLFTLNPPGETPLGSAPLLLPVHWAPSHPDGACLIDSICPTVKTLRRCPPPAPTPREPADTCQGPAAGSPSRATAGSSDPGRAEPGRHPWLRGRSAGCTGSTRNADQTRLSLRELVFTDPRLGCDLGDDLVQLLSSSQCPGSPSPPHPPRPHPLRQRWLGL